MSVVGSWTLHYGWGCTGTYGQSDITFDGDGTFSGDFTGRWVQQDGTLLWSYDSGPAKYGGTVNGNVGSGAVSDFAGSDGCWYLVKQGTIGLAAPGAGTAAEQPQPQDASGRPTSPR